MLKRTSNLAQRGSGGFVVRSCLDSYFPFVHDLFKGATQFLHHVMFNGTSNGTSLGSGTVVSAFLDAGVPYVDARVNCAA